MAISQVLILVGVCLGLTLAQQQCDQQIKDFQACLGQSMKKPGQAQGAAAGAGDRPNFADMKKKMDDCFTSNGCDAPKFGGPGGPQAGKAPQAGQAPQGGRAGRVLPTAVSDDHRKCFEGVNNKTKDYMLSCMRKADPSFSFPSKVGGGDHHGPGGEGDHHFGGPGGFGQKGRGGPAGPGGPVGGSPQKFLLDQCKNNADNAAKVNVCMAGVLPHGQNKPDTEQMRKTFNDRCTAKTACEAKLGPCKAIMEKRRTDMCKCGQEVASKRQEFLQQEPSCAGQKQPQRPGSAGPPQVQKQHDCTQNDDPCTKGFDAMIKETGNRRPH